MWWIRLSPAKERSQGKGSGEMVVWRRLGWCFFLVFWAFEGCQGERCNWSDTNGQITWVCGGVSYIVRDGAEGKAGQDGAQGSHGGKGVAGPSGEANCVFLRSQTDPRTGVLRCKGVGEKEYSKEWTVLNGDGFQAAGVCRFEVLDADCGAFEVICGEGSEQSRFQIGVNSCNTFSIEKLDKDGKETGEILRNGIPNRPGDSLDIHERYQFTLRSKNIQATQTPGLYSFSRYRCHSASECNPSYCDILRTQGAFRDRFTAPPRVVVGAYDRSCRAGSVQADCGESTDFCREFVDEKGNQVGLCYEKATGVGCSKDVDCVGVTTEKDALVLGRVFCDTLRGDCYRRKIKQKEYDYCRLARGQLVEGLCVFYPFAEDRTGEGTGKCLLFRFSGGLRRVPSSGSEIVYSRATPGGTPCNWVKVIQTLFYPGQTERNKSIWDTVDREEQVGSPHFFSGFAEFVDGTRKYFFHEFYANAEAFWQSCSCPPEKQTFNPTTGQCE